MLLISRAGTAGCWEEMHQHLLLLSSRPNMLIIFTTLLIPEVHDPYRASHGSLQYIGIHYGRCSTRSKCLKVASRECLPTPSYVIDANYSSERGFFSPLLLRATALSEARKVKSSEQNDAISLSGFKRNNQVPSFLRRT